MRKSVLQIPILAVDQAQDNVTSYAFFQSCVSEITERLNIKFGTGYWH